MVYELRHARQETAYPDPPSREELDAFAIPRYARVQIPLDDPYWLRAAADELRNLANSLDLLGRRTDEKPRVLLGIALMEIRSCNQKLSYVTKSSRSGRK